MVGLTTFSYLGGNSPRTPLGDNVYTSTEYPAVAAITLHQELSYERDFPELCLFLCGRPATRGGATPLCDARVLLHRLPETIVEHFTSRGLRYVQRLPSGDGLGKSWPETFDTTDRTACEQILADRDVEYAWEPDGTLVLVRRRSALRSHSRRGWKIWFNQADQWHPSAVGSGRARAVLERMYHGRLPHDVTYGDGTPIPDAYIREVSSVSRALSWVEPWRRGDLLVLDNEATMHGRDSYSGPRAVFVAIARLP
jgi:hypothetical protein